MSDPSRCTTRRVLKWIAVGVALHVALRELIFCRDEVVVEHYFNIFALLMAAGWVTEENEGSYKRTTTNYEGGANALVLGSM